MINHQNSQINKIKSGYNSMDAYRIFSFEFNIKKTWRMIIIVIKQIVQYQHKKWIICIRFEYMKPKMYNKWYTWIEGNWEWENDILKQRMYIQIM